MSDMPDIVNKRVLSVRVHRETYRKLQCEAKERKMGFNEYIRHIINEATLHVDLTPEDYAIITKEREQDIERARAKGRFPKSRKAR
jgi:hypothetical protein